MKRRNYIKSVGASFTLPLTGKVTAQSNEGIRAVNAQYTESGDVTTTHVLIPPEYNATEIAIRAGVVESYQTKNLVEKRDVRDETVYQFIHGAGSLNKSSPVSVFVDGRESKINNVRQHSKARYDYLRYGHTVDDVMFYSLKLYAGDGAILSSRKYNIREDIDSLSIDIRDRSNGEWVSYEHSVEKVTESVGGEEYSWVSATPCSEDDIVYPDEFNTNSRKRIRAVDDDGKEVNVPLSVSMSFDC